jgi:hypothetical protein
MHNATKRRWGHEVDVIIIGTGAAGNHHPGTRLVGGNALIARLYKTLPDRQFEVWLHASATRLITEDGTVVGAEVI